VVVKSLEMSGDSGLAPNDAVASAVDMEGQ
jgi:hypothetical protein